MRIRSSIKSKLASSVILLIIGLIFMGVAIGLNVNDSVKKSNWIMKEATIVDIDHYKEVIKLSYTYNNLVYQRNSSIYSSFSDIGDIIIIYVNPDNPIKFYEKETSIIFIVFYCVSIPFVTAGLFMISSYFKNKNRVQLCLDNGRKRVAKVLEIKKTCFYYNYQPYYVLKVIYNNIEYKSEKFLLPETLNLNMDVVVDVYIIDEKNYYVDTKSLREKNDFDF